MTPATGHSVSAPFPRLGRDVLPDASKVAASTHAPTGDKSAGPATRDTRRRPRAEGHRPPRPTASSGGQPAPDFGEELRRRVAASRTAQGLPRTVRDRATLARLAQLLHCHAERTGGQVAADPGRLEARAPADRGERRSA